MVVKWRWLGREGRKIIFLGLLGEEAGLLAWCYDQYWSRGMSVVVKKQVGFSV